MESSKILTVNTNNGDTKFARMKIQSSVTNAVNQNVHWFYANIIFMVVLKGSIMNVYTT